MKPEFIYIAASSPDGGVSIMMFITKEYQGSPLTDDKIKEKVNEHIADWKQQKLKYDQRDIDSMTEHYENIHIRWIREPTNENIEAELLKSGVVYNEYHIVDDLPERTFRGAWIMNDGQISHDIDKCKSIFIDRLRYERESQFTQTDKDYLIAQQQKEDTAMIEEQSQYLRDLPALVSEDIKGFTDVAEFKNYQIPWQKQK